MRIKPSEYKHFYFPDEKKKKYITISYYEMSTGHIIGWSGYFSLRKLCQISFKMKLPKIHGYPHEEQENYDLQKIIITMVEETIMLVRIVSEAPSIPPYYLENLTKYEITIRQKMDMLLK